MCVYDGALVEDAFHRATNRVECAVPPGGRVANVTVCYETSGRREPGRGRRGLRLSGFDGGDVVVDAAVGDAVTCAAPAAPAGFGSLALRVYGETGFDDAAVDFAAPRPTLVAATPAVLPESGGLVKVAGGDFDAGLPVYCDFSGSFEPASVLSATEIACLAPPRRGDADVVLRVGHAKSELSAAAVVLDYFHPATLFEASPAVGVLAGGTEVVSKNEIRCVSPGWGEPGPVDLWLSLNDGFHFSLLPGAFTYVDKVHVDSAALREDDTNTTVVVEGAGFLDAPYLSHCVIDDTVLVEITALTDDRVECDVDASVVAAAAVVALSAGALDAVSNKARVVARAAVVASVGVAATSSSSGAPTSPTSRTSPATMATTHTRPRGCRPRASSARCPPAPRTRRWPSSAAAAATMVADAAVSAAHRTTVSSVERATTARGVESVRALGTNFDAAREMLCIFDGRAWRYATHVSENAVECPLPPAGTSSVSVLSEGVPRLENASLADAALAVGDAPVVAPTRRARPAVGGRRWRSRRAVREPGRGVRRGRRDGDRRGRQLPRDAALACAFGDVAVDAVWVSAAAVLCVAPPLEPGTSELRVVRLGDAAAGPSVPFVALPDPHANALLAPFAPAIAGGDVVAVAGVGFEHATAEAACRFGDRVVAAAADGAFRCVARGSPRRAPGPGVALVTVENDCGRPGASGANVTFVARSLLSSLTPSSLAFEESGAVVRISGNASGDAFGLPVACDFGGLETRADVLDGEVYCATPAAPAGAPRTVDVTVLEHEAIAARFEGAEITFAAAPRVDAVVPRSAPVAGSAALTVLGDFPGEAPLYCRFGNASTPAARRNASALACAAPPGVPGDVDFDVGYSADLPAAVGASFAYYELPHVAGVSPAFGAAGALVTVTTTAPPGASRPAAGAACAFGETVVAADALSTSEFRCAVPSLPPGLYAVSAALDGAHFARRVDAVPFQVLELPSVVLARPRGPARGGTACRSSARASRLRRVGAPGLRLRRPPLAAAVRVADDEVRCLAPPAMKTGTVPLTLALDGARAATAATFAYDAVVVVVAVAPRVVPGGGGTPVVVTLEDDAADGIACHFGDVVVAPTAVAGPEVTCPSPKRGAGAVEVAVSLNGVDVSEGLTVEFTAPLEGRGFEPSGGLACDFGVGAAAPAVFVSSSEIRCEAPPFPAAGVYRVRVRTADGVLDADGVDFEVGGAPIILDVDAVVGSPTGGAEVVGARFRDTAQLGCRFVSDEADPRDAPASAATYVSATKLRCAAPDTLRATTSRVEVTVNGVEYSTQDVFYTRLAPPFSARGGPARGSELGGAAVRVDGVSVSENTTTLDAACVFGTTVAEARVVDGDVYCIAPALAPGYAAYAAPSVAAVAPALGSTAGDTLITVTGVNLAALAPGASCVFDGDAYVPAEIVGRDALRCLSPPLAAGVVALTVASPSTAPLSPGVPFSVAASLALQVAAPATGPSTGGTNVTILGDFSTFLKRPADASCAFGDRDVAAALVNASALACVAPAAAGKRRVALAVVDGGDGSRSSALAYDYEHPIAIYAMTEGLQDGALAATGANFLDGVGLSCRLAGRVFEAKWMSSTLVVCFFPPKSERPALDESTRAAVSNNGVDFVEFFGDAHASSLEPAAAAPGALIRVRASNVRGPGLLACRFGDHAPVSGTYVEEDVVDCAAPATGGAGEVADVRVAVDGRSFGTTSAAFTFLATPTLLALSPARGWRTGGFTTTLAVSGVPDHATDCACLFGYARVAATFANSTLTCAAPAWTPTLPSDAVVVAAVCAVDGADVAVGPPAQLEYVDPVEVYRADPSFGSDRGGTTVSLKGANFPNAVDLACVFGESSVPATWVSSVEIECATPAAPFPATVAVAASLGGLRSSHSSASFAYVSPTVVRSAAPLETTHLGGAVVNVTGDRFDGNSKTTCDFGGPRVPATVVNASLLRCVAPARPPGAITAHVRVFRDVVGSFPFSYVLGEAVVAVSPTGGPTTGGGVVRVRGSGFTTTTLICFDGVSARTTFVSSSEVRAVAPPSTRAAVARVDASRGRAAAAESAYEPRTLVVGVDPPYGPENGGTSVTVVGRFSTAHGPVACRFGDREANATLLSDSAVTCASPPRGDDRVAVAVSLVYDAAEPPLASGHVFTYISSATATDAAPLAAPCDGGTVVAISGTGFVDDGRTSCNFGGSTVDAVFLSATNLACVAPRWRRNEDVATFLEIASEKQPTLSRRFAFTYEAVVATDPGADGEFPVVYAATPAVILAEGGALVTVEGRNFARHSDALACRFGDLVAAATFQDDGTLTCAAPARIPSRVRLQVSNDGGGFWSPTYAEVTFASEPSVYALEPASGPLKGATAVRVFGSHFFGDVLCRFGDSLAPASVVSDVERLLCVTPPHAAGEAMLEVSLNGVDFYGTFLKYAFAETPKIESLWPLMSMGQIGATAVSVFGSGFRNTLELACFSIIRACPRGSSPSAISCVAPARAPGLASVHVTVNGRDMASNTLNLLYVPEVLVTSVWPSRALATARAPVFVVGANFVNSTALKCAFGDVKVRGTYVSSSVVACVPPNVDALARGHRESGGAPQMDRRSLRTGDAAEDRDEYASRVSLLPRYVEVRVSVNGLDYSDGAAAFEYYDELEKGYYETLGSAKPCPNGTLCRGAKPTNFTLCPPGTFQPRGGQVACLACPVGYYCPDFGLSKPVLCPGGFVCSDLGEREPKTPCPPGHYCNPGTKSSDPFAFANNSEYERDAETGVVYLVPPRRDWRLDRRSLPETGTYAPGIHPPRPFDASRPMSSSRAVLAELPFPCPPGTYCARGASSPVSIPGNFSTPQRCFDGYFCPAGSGSPEGEGPCPTGHFCPTQMLAVACPLGHHLCGNQIFNPTSMCA
ncbi:hypothetical protein JL722_819 [Aureococcus anophagefferens]|nr:hypothetical protein JL722_819 [Aureococcus anophagefferens]